MANIYNGKLYFTCDMCHGEFRVERYLHRIHFDEVDAEEFHPRGTLGVQICYACNEKVKNFVFGPEERDVVVQKRPHDDWDQFLKIKRSGKLEELLALAEETKEKEVR